MLVKAPGFLLVIISLIRENSWTVLKTPLITPIIPMITNYYFTEFLGVLEELHGGF